MAKAVFQATIVNDVGTPIPFAVVTVEDAETALPATLWDNRAGTGDTLDGETSTNSQGFVRFYVNSGRYNITATKGTQVRAWEDIVLLDDPASPGTVDAEDVAYDNGDSGLAATDVQAAIDELATEGGGGGDAWQLHFGPLQNEGPATNYATLDLRNSRAVLDFDATTQEAAIFTGVLPNGYGGGGLTVDIFFAATVAISGTIGWDVAIERMDASSLDIDSDSFAAAITVTAATVPSTSGQFLKSSVDIADGADMDNLAAGEMFRIRIRRDVANDSATGDAELLAVCVRESA